MGWLDKTKEIISKNAGDYSLPFDHPGVPHLPDKQISTCIICWCFCDDAGNEITVDEVCKLRGWT